MIKVIAFDYGGVIKVNDNDLFTDIATYLKITRQEFSDEYFSLNHLFNIQHKSYEDLIMRVISRFTNSKDDQNHILNLTRENHKNYHLNNDLIEIIRELKSKDYKIALLSNNSNHLKETLVQDEIFDLFDSIVISAEFGYQKPNPEIFNILFTKLDVKPSEVIFIDDTPKSLEGAEDIGYFPILYKNNESLKSQISQILSAAI